MSDVTELLQQWNSENEDARTRLIDLIYGELNSIARRQLAGERAAAVEIQPTMLVHEAYMRLAKVNRIDWQDRAHFLAVAARIMREYLIDEARRRRASKRDGGVQVTLSGVFVDSENPATDVLALNDALEKLAASDPERARLVELRFFGGLTIEETADALGVSARTVKRSWQVARGWLYREMNKGAQ